LRNLPEVFGSWNSVFRRFRRCAKAGIIERLFPILLGDPDFTYACLDRRHNHPRPQARDGRKRGAVIERSRGGLTTKIAALVDALGNLAHILYLPGQRHDCVGAEALVGGIKVGALIADKGLDTDARRQELDARSATAVIPPKANRAADCM
jgi:transposase